MDFDNLYQDIIFDHFKQPRNKADLSSIPEEEALENPSCGDSIKLRVRFSPEGIVETIEFDGHGCAISQASTSMMTERLKGLDRESAQREINDFYTAMQGKPELLQDKDDLESLQGVCKFPARIKCATLAWHAMEIRLHDGKTG